VEKRIDDLKKLKPNADIFRFYLKKRDNEKNERYKELYDPYSKSIYNDIVC